MVSKRSLEMPDIKRLTRLSADEITEFTKTLTDTQKERMMEMLADKEAPPWIQQAKKAHKDLGGFMQSIPTDLPSKPTRIQEIVKSIMITAGDVIPPHKNTVAFLTSHLAEWGKYLTKKCSSVKQLRKEAPEAANKFFVHKDTREVNLETELETSDFEASLDQDPFEVERLRFNDLRTQSMSAEEYRQFVKSRRMNFYSNSRKAFLKLIGASPTSSAKFIELLSYLAWSHLQQVIETALRRRSATNELEVQTEALRVQELEDVLSEIS
jgi:hypothetical protein